MTCTLYIWLWQYNRISEDDAASVMDDLDLIKDEAKGHCAIATTTENSKEYADDTANILYKSNK